MEVSAERVRLFAKIGICWVDQCRGHMDQHVLPYKCSVRGCVFWEEGFSSIVKRDVHEVECHAIVREVVVGDVCGVIDGDGVEEGQGVVGERSEPIMMEGVSVTLEDGDEGESELDLDEESGGLRVELFSVSWRALCWCWIA
jgi:hypothetical protein